MKKEDLPVIKDGRVLEPFKVEKITNEFVCHNDKDKWGIKLDYSNRLIHLSKGGYNRVLKECGEVMKKGYTEFNDVKHLCNKAQFHILYACGLRNYFSNYKNLFLDFDKDKWQRKYPELIKNVRAVYSGSKNNTLVRYVRGVSCYLDQEKNILFKSGEKKFVYSDCTLLYEVRKNDIGILSKPVNFLNFSEDKKFFNQRNYLGDGWFFDEYVNHDKYQYISDSLDYSGCGRLNREDFDRIVEIVNQNGDLILEDDADELSSRKGMLHVWKISDSIKIQKLERDKEKVIDRLDLMSYNALIKRVKRRKEITEYLEAQKR